MRKQDNKHRMIESSVWHRDRAVWLLWCIISTILFFSRSFLLLLTLSTSLRGPFPRKKWSNHSFTPLLTSSFQLPTISRLGTLWRPGPCCISSTQHFSGHWDYRKYVWIMTPIFKLLKYQWGRQDTSIKRSCILIPEEWLSLSLICLISFFPSSPLNC